MRKKRVRQHVNPLGFRREVARPDWAAFFAVPSRPLEVEIGCGKGTFLVARTRSEPDVNVVGLEIREPMVERTRREIERAGLANAHVIFCNANQSFAELFAPASLSRVYVHFPDPWFKPRHRKRRVLTPELLDVLASRLASKGELHFMTDYAAYAESARALVEGHPAFRNKLGPGAAATGPLLPVLSDREAWHMARGDAVHRYLFQRL